MDKFLRIILFITLFSSIPLIRIEAQDPQLLENHEIQDYVYNLQQAEAPKRFQDALVFSQERQGYTRYIGIAFEHEQFNPIHVFYRNRHGIFFFVYPVDHLPHNLKELRYRVVSDGVWTRDHMTHHYVKDNQGSQISVLPIDNGQTWRPEITRAIGDGYVEFFIRAPEHSQVFVMGTFNRWNPFSHRMREHAPGRYSLSLRMSQGYHAYTFIINGHTMDISSIDASPDDRVFVGSLGSNAIRILVK